MQEHIPRTSECVALKQGLISQFDQRFKSKEHVSLLAQATILDPRFKKVPFQDRVACSRAQQMIADTLFLETAVDATSLQEEEQPVNNSNDKNNTFWTNYKNKAKSFNEKKRIG